MAIRHRFGVRKAIADSGEFVPAANLLLGFAVRFDPEVFTNVLTAAEKHGDAAGGGVHA